MVAENPKREQQRQDEARRRQARIVQATRDFFKQNAGRRQEQRARTES